MHRKPVMSAHNWKWFCYNEWWELLETNQLETKNTVFYYIQFLQSVPAGQNFWVRFNAPHHIWPLVQTAQFFSKGWPRSYPGYCLHLWNPPLQLLNHSQQIHCIWDNCNQLVSQHYGGFDDTGWIFKTTTVRGHRLIVVVSHAVPLLWMMKWLQWRIL